jgi:hypothetical protein
LRRQALEHQQGRVPLPDGAACHRREVPDRRSGMQVDEHLQDHRHRPVQRRRVEARHPALRHVPALHASIGERLFDERRLQVLPGHRLLHGAMRLRRQELVVRSMLIRFA